MRGTPSFLSPEQARGVALTAASDVFSLAGNLAYALTGRRPFDPGTGSMLEEVMAILQAPAPDVPTYAPGLAAVLARAFAKDPSHRYATPGDFGAALYECIPDAGEHDAVTSDRLAAWWPTSRDAIGPNHDLEGPWCRQRWENLDGTGDVRHCQLCDQSVVRATSPLAVLPLLGRHCVSYRPD
jgi:serine/threonine protein kinase